MAFISKPTAFPSCGCRDWIAMPQAQASEEPQLIASVQRIRRTRPASWDTLAGGLGSGGPAEAQRRQHCLGSCLHLPEFLCSHRTCPAQVQVEAVARTCGMQGES